MTNTTITSAEFLNRPNDYLALADQTPVTIDRLDKPSVTLISIEEYHRLLKLFTPASDGTCTHGKCFGRYTHYGANPKTRNNLKAHLSRLSAIMRGLRASSNHNQLQVITTPPKYND